MELESRFISIANRVIRLRAPTKEVAVSLENLLSNWTVTFLRQPPTQPVDADISVRAATALPQIPPDFEVFEFPTGGQCLTNGETYFFRLENALVKTAAQTPIVEVWLSADLPEMNKSALMNTVTSAFTVALRRCGSYELHAAALAHPATGAGLLLAGKTHSGKSTLAVSLASRGWRHLSDDTILLRLENGAVKADSLRHGFVLRPKTIEKLSLPEFRKDTRGLAMKRRFDSQDLFADQFQHSCKPSAIFFPTITEEEVSRTEKLSQTEAVQQLMKISPWSCFDRPIAEKNIALLVQLSKQCKLYNLSLGTDLLDVDAANAFFERYY